MNVVQREAQHLNAGLDCRRTGMRREHNVAEASKRGVVERLLLIDIQGRTLKRASLQREIERDLINHAASRKIDEPTLAQSINDRRANQVMSLLATRVAQHQNV